MLLNCGFGRKAMTNLDNILESRDITLLTKGLYGESYGFSSSHVWMWELDHKENWVLKNWCFWTVVLEMTLWSPLDCKEIKALNPKGNQSWIFISKMYAVAEAPILWPPYVKRWLIEKGPNAGKKLKVGVEGEDREWYGSMASPAQWTWVWASSRGWWWKSKPDVLQFMGKESDLQRVQLTKSQILLSTKVNWEKKPFFIDSCLIQWKLSMKYDVCLISM